MAQNVMKKLTQQMHVGREHGTCQSLEGALVEITKRSTSKGGSTLLIEVQHITEYT